MAINSLLGLYLNNIRLFKEAKKIGFDYILNPDTGEIHNVNSDFLGSHNLNIKDLENFIGLANIGIIDIHKFKDGATIPVYDVVTKDYLGEYKLNKYKHCSW